MAKSFWMKDQKGNFSNGGDDTFDETKDYIGIRLQQGVPLLDRDWNELEDIRRNQDRIIRKNYLGDGTPDNGFAISLITGKIDDFAISKGRCLVDGFEALNRADIAYKGQKDVPSLTIPDGKRTDTVYVDLWISEIHGTDELKNNQDIKMETCARHKVEWKVLVNEAGKPIDPVGYHHYYQIATIERNGKIISAIRDLRTALRINPLFGAFTVTNDKRIGIGTADPKRTLHVEGSEIHSGGPIAGLSFADKFANNGAYVEDGSNGTRWVWYAANGYACLWTAQANKLWIDAKGNINTAGGISFGGIGARQIYGDLRANSHSVVLKGNWDELEVKGRVIDWTGTNLHIGYHNDHKDDFVYLGYGDKRIKGLAINHGAVVGAKYGDNVGLKLNSADGGGVIYGSDMNHSIFLRVGQDGSIDVTDYHQAGSHRFFTGGLIEAQKERMRITTNGAIGIGTADPKRILHVEGGEIHSGGANGSTAGFSFANRDAPNKGAYVESGVDGQRWVWYSAGQIARLWAEDDKLSIDKRGNVIINHGAVKGAKTADNIGLKLNSADGGGVIFGFDMNHSIFLRVGQDGTTNVTDYHQHGSHRFFTGGSVEAQKERMRITENGSIGIGTADPKRILHVEGGEIHSGGANGSTAGFSFANRDAPNKGAYVESGADGQRWVWYAQGQSAHLWAKEDKLSIDKSGNVVINHGAVKGAKTADNIGLKLNSDDEGGVIFGFDMNHSIFLRVGQDGTLNVTDYHQWGNHRFFTGGGIDVQKERLRIDSSGNVIIMENLGFGSYFSKIVPIYIRGSGNVADATGKYNRILVIGNKTFYDEGGRGLKLTIIRKSDLAQVHNETYNTNDDLNAVERLKTKILESTYFNMNHIYVLTSCEAWEGKININYLSFFKEIGLTKAGTIDITAYGTRPYAAIFEPNQTESGFTTKLCKACEILLAHDLSFSEINGLLINGRFVGC